MLFLSPATRSNKKTSLPYNLLPQQDQKHQYTVPPTPSTRPKTTAYHPTVTSPNSARPKKTEKKKKLKTDQSIQLCNNNPIINGGFQFNSYLFTMSLVHLLVLLSQQSRLYHSRMASSIKGVTFRENTDPHKYLWSIIFTVFAPVLKLPIHTHTIICVYKDLVLVKMFGKKEL